MSNPYRALGIGLCLAGAIFAPVSYFIINSVPFTAIGLSAVMIGFTCVALANARPYISPEACQLLMKTGMENTSALLEELGLTNKAVYIPSAMRDGHPQAIVPLTDNGNIRLNRGTIPGRLIVRYGINPEDMAISVTTPGSINIDVLETLPGPGSDEIEAAISYILTGVLDIADSVNVNMTDGKIIVDVRNPKIMYENIWYYRCMGSPIASIAAAISSEAMGAPVRVSEEKTEKGKSRIILEVIG